MKFLILLFLYACSHSQPEFDSSPPMPQEAPAESISKPQNDLKVAIEQTKSYYCIKNEEQFNKGISCGQYSQIIHNECIKKYRKDNLILDCILKSLKI